MKDRNPFQLNRAAGVLKSMGHPIRLKILCLLLGAEKNVSELKNSLGESASNISQHLTILRSHGAIGSRKESNHIYYKIVQPGLESLISTIQTLFCKE